MLEQYDHNLDNTSTVIISRTLKTSYIWPKHKPLTIDDLQVFAEHGHTLGIDYAATYCRMFALDLDCVCRTGSNFEHLGENVVNLIIAKLNEVFAQMVNKPPAFSVWRNQCGFHVYSDILVSMPTHFYIKKQLESFVEFQNQPVVFEVPSVMPLPFSAKVRGKPYTLNTRSENMTDVSMTICMDQQDCLELFAFTQLALEGRTAAKLTTILGNQYLVKLAIPTIRRASPKIINLSYIKLYDNFSYMKQFEEYAISMSKHHNIQNTTISDIDFQEFTAEERAQIRLFMSMINTLFGSRDGQDSCSTFINISALDYGGLYLQPFVAALFLHLQDVGLFTNFDRFRLVLVKMYHSAMIQYSAVRQFVDLLNVQSLQAYSEETGESIIKHLHFMISHSTLPTQTLDEQINTIMEKKTDITATVSCDTINRECSKRDKSAAEKLICDLLESFRDIFFEMKILYYDQSSSRYYSLNPKHSAAYESSAKLSNYLYPSVIRAWVGYTKTATTILKTKLEDAHHIHIQDPINFAQTEYMFSTQVGVFNSATGLYTARSRFLRFSKFRYSSVWPFGQPEVTFYAQNETLLEHYSAIVDIIKIIHESLFEIYTHSIFAPAIIQLRSLMSISEQCIGQTLTILSHFKQYEPAYFLLEYYPFDPKIIYLMLHLSEKYGGIECFSSYKILCAKVFRTEQVTVEQWSAKYTNIMTGASYDDSQTGQLEKLKSLSGVDASDCADDMFLVVTIVLACIVKCDAFDTFVQAFNIVDPKTTYQHPRYTDFDRATNLKTMKSNMTRARSIIFGENISRFRHTIIDELLSICMSADFRPETVVNYLTAVGSMYIPINVLKKLVLIHGDQDVGKSLACKKITAIAQPSSGRFDDISAVMARSSVAEYSAVILNEASSLNAAQLKIVTGNDDTSSMKFYSQKYELQKMQTHMFGATNLHVSFKGRGDVDKTSVSRLYAIQFTGINCSADAPHSSLMSMMVGGLYFSGILSPILAQAIEALKWLSFGMYMSIRDANYFPKLDLSCDTCRQYQHTVHYNNSVLYKFLVDSEIIDAPGFSITKEKLFSIISMNLDKTGEFQTLSAFKLAFEKQYNISFEKTTHVKNFQQLGLIQHVANNMLAIEVPNSRIDRADITNRLKLYTRSEYKDAAKDYFQRTYEKYFNYTNTCYEGLAFVSEDPCTSDKFISFDGNTDDAAMNIDENSLVMHCV